jgi:hypothetical protein
MLFLLEYYLLASVIKNTINNKLCEIYNFLDILKIAQYFKMRASILKIHYFTNFLNSSKSLNVFPE